MNEQHASFLSRRISERKLADAAVSAIGFMTYALASELPAPDLALSTVLLVELGYCIVMVRKNRLLLLMYAVMAYAGYSICYANYLHPLPETMFTSLSASPEALEAMRLFTLFATGLVLFLPSKVQAYGEGDSAFSSSNSNPILVCALAIVLMLILFYGFERPDVLGGERGSPSALYEYSTILFIIGFYLAGSRRGLQVLLLAILALFAFQNLAYGGRVTALQLILIAFFFLANGKVSNRTLVVFGLAAFVFFLGFGGVRTSVWESGLAGIIDSFAKSLEKGLAWDTAYSSWHTSVTFVKYDALISPEEHVYLLRQWLASIILGGSLVPDASLAALTRPYFFHYYGGVLPVFVWFYLGIIGVLAFAAYVSFFSRQIAALKTNSESSGITQASLQLSLLYVAVTVPRWFLYSPSQITRGLLLCLLICAVLLWVDRNMRKRREKISR